MHSMSILSLITKEAVTEDLLDTKEAARFLAVVPQTVRRYVREGRLRAFLVGPRLVRFRRSDLYTLLVTLAKERGEQVTVITPGDCLCDGELAPVCPLHTPTGRPRRSANK